MKLLVDSSALAKRYVIEESSGALDRLLQRASELGLCIILVPEIISGLNRRLREQILSEKDYRKIKRQLMAAKNSGLRSEYIGQPIVSAAAANLRPDHAESFSCRPFVEP